MSESNTPMFPNYASVKLILSDGKPTRTPPEATTSPRLVASRRAASWIWRHARPSRISTGCGSTSVERSVSTRTSSSTAALGAPRRSWRTASKSWRATWMTRGGSPTPPVMVPAPVSGASTGATSSVGSPTTPRLGRTTLPCKRLLGRRRVSVRRSRLSASTCSGRWCKNNGRDLGLRVRQPRSSYHHRNDDW